MTLLKLIWKFKICGFFKRLEIPEAIKDKNNNQTL